MQEASLRSLFFIPTNLLSAAHSRCAIEESRFLNTLEENGFIVRKAVSGSKNGIYLTEKAISERKLISEAINTAVNRGREGMSEEEYENGLDFLKKIHTNISGGTPIKHNPI